MRGGGKEEKVGTMALTCALVDFGGMVCAGAPNLGSKDGYLLLLGILCCFVFGLA